MEIGPVNRADLSAPVNPISPTQDSISTVRQVVVAIRGLNKSELVAEGRALVYARDPETRRPVIHVVERETGNVVDQIPLEEVLRMHAEMQAMLKES